MLAASFGESKGSLADRPTLCSVEWRRDNLKAAALLPPKDKSALLLLLVFYSSLDSIYSLLAVLQALQLEGRFSP